MDPWTLVCWSISSCRSLLLIFVCDSITKIGGVLPFGLGERVEETPAEIA